MATAFPSFIYHLSGWFIFKISPLYFDCLILLQFLHLGCSRFWYDITSFHFRLFSLFPLPAADADALACSKDNFCMRGLSNFYPDLTKRIRTSYQSKFYKG